MVRTLKNYEKMKTMESELLDNEGSELSDDELNHVRPELPCNSPASNYASCPTIGMWLVRFLALLRVRHYIPDATISSLLKLLHVLHVVLGRFSTFVVLVTLLKH